MLKLLSKMCAVLCCNYATFTGLGQLGQIGQHDTRRNYTIGVMSPMVAKASKGGKIMAQNQGCLCQKTLPMEQHIFM
jgi:hypothetical protein